MEKVIGATNGITLKLGEPSGALDFTIVLMDDFKVVLGQKFMRKKFMRKTEAILSIPHMDMLVIFLGFKPHVISSSLTLFYRKNNKI